MLMCFHDFNSLPFFVLDGWTGGLMAVERLLSLLPLEGKKKKAGLHMQSMAAAQIDPVWSLVSCGWKCTRARHPRLVVYALHAHKSG
jgi:hypothetical protein